MKTIILFLQKGVMPEAFTSLSGFLRAYPQYSKQKSSIEHQISRQKQGLFEFADNNAILYRLYLKNPKKQNPL